VSRIMKLHSGRLHILNAPSGGASIQLVWKNARSRPRRRWSIGGARSALEAAWYGADHR
jgi:hypothetical protein